MARNRTLVARGLIALAIVLFFPLTARGQAVQSAAKRTALLPVRIGDHVVVHFLREPQLNAEVVVDEHGDAAFPKIGVLQVTRYTIGALQDSLRARYSEFLRLPELEVSVLRRITVNGEVRQPNVYMVDASSTVRDVIARAGGITDVGNRSKVIIVRDGTETRVKNWRDGTDDGADLQSGDQIIVARQSWLALNSLSVLSTAILVTSFVLAQIKR